jgi:hypothetical protein
MKKIGILYICTGEYSKFWNDFYKSAEKYFLNDCEVHYFIFTDSDILLNLDKKMVHSIYSANQDWPYPTLLRYETFNTNKKYFDRMDYLIFCNANLLFKECINIDTLLANSKMFAVMHPGYIDKPIKDFPYEDNQKSLAYINRSKNSKYFCGGFNGGKREYFLKMVDELNNNINIDLNNNIIAIWHDESHFNCYTEKNDSLFNILGSEFCHPEYRGLKPNIKVLVKDKDKEIGIRHKGLVYAGSYYIFKYLKIFKNVVTAFKK